MPSNLSQAVPFVVSSPQLGVTNIGTKGSIGWRLTRFAGIFLLLASPVFAFTGIDNSPSIFWAERFTDQFWFGLEGFVVGGIVWAVGYQLGFDHLCQIDRNAQTLAIWRIKGGVARSEKFACSIAEISKIDVEVFGDGKERRSVVCAFLNNGTSHQLSPQKTFTFEHADAFCEAVRGALREKP